MTISSKVDEYGALKDQIKSLEKRVDALAKDIRAHALETGLSIVAGYQYNVTLAERNAPDKLDRELLYRTYGLQSLIDQGIVTTGNTSLVMQYAPARLDVKKEA